MPIYMQGDDESAKQSTRYLARGANLAGCSTDLSHYFTNLTAGVSNLLETMPNSARLDFSHPRTIGFRIELASADTGTFFRHGSLSPTRLDIFAAGTIRAVVNNAVVGTLVPPSLTAAPREFVIAWTSRANPDTTGASDAVESTLHAWRTSTGTPYDRSTFRHAASTTKAQTAFFGAADNVGTSVFAGTITGIWFEARYMSATEIASDWVTTISAPSTNVVSSEQGLPVLESSGIGDVGYLHGPAAQWCTDATRRMYRRCSSPLVNEALRIRTTWQSTTLTGPFWRGIPGAAQWRTHLTWLRECIVPETCTHVWVRAHVRTWTTSGSAVPLGVRIYSSNKRLGAGGEPLALYYGEEIVTRDDDASVGNWCVDEVIPVSRSADGRTYVMVAFRIDPNSASANDANERFALNAIHVVPCLVDADAGLQFGEMP